MADPTQGDEFLFDENHFRALARGDAAAENLLVAHFSMAVVSHLQARLLSAEWVEDAREETFRRVLRYLRGGNAPVRPAGLLGFVQAICDNVASEILRARGPSRG